MRRTLTICLFLLSVFLLPFAGVALAIGSIIFLVVIYGAVIAGFLHWIGVFDKPPEGPPGMGGGGPGQGPGAAEAGGPGGAVEPLRHRAVRWRAAARGHCPGTHKQPGCDLCR